MFGGGQLPLWEAPGGVHGAAAWKLHVMSSLAVSNGAAAQTVQLHGTPSPGALPAVSRGLLQHHSTVIFHPLQHRLGLHSEKASSTEECTMNSNGKTKGSKPQERAASSSSRAPTPVLKPAAEYADISIFPRRKAGQSGIGSNRPQVVTTRDVLEEHFNMPLLSVCKKLVRFLLQCDTCFVPFIVCIFSSVDHLQC